MPCGAVVMEDVGTQGNPNRAANVADNMCTPLAEPAPAALHATHGSQLQTLGCDDPYSAHILKPESTLGAGSRNIKERHGGYASWAVWAEASGKPKSNMGDLTIFDPDAKPSLLQTLTNDVVMVGLNFSKPPDESFDAPFRNFHDPSPRANDFKIRYAFINTPYYGAYMTDIIKSVVTVASSAALQYLKTNPAVVKESIATFREELADLGSSRPTILAFGAAAHRLIADNVPANAYSRLVKLTHYSHRIGKEEYSRTVLSQADSR